MHRENFTTIINAQEVLNVAAKMVYSNSNNYIK